MKKSFIVIGLGRFGSNVAKALASMNCDVLAVDIDEESVSSIAKHISHCVIADATKQSVLSELGAASIDHAVVAIGNNLQASILTVLNLKKLGVKRITVRADEEGHKEIYKLLGATEVILPEEVSAISIANQIISDSILDYYQVADDFAIVKTIVGEKFEQKPLIDLDIRNCFDVNIVGIIDKDNQFFIPRGTDVLKPKDVVVVVGKKQNIKKFDSFLNN
ncbi:MAG: potassium channel family protein [Anaeroplasma sp.]